MTVLATDIRTTRVGNPYASMAQAASGNDLGIDIEAIRKHVQVQRCKHVAGQSIYHAGQPFHAVYLVHAGSYKICELADDGRERISGFRMRGELVGVESIGLKAYASDVVALESSEAWELPYPAVLRACLHVPELQSHLTSALAAERRVAAFLLDVAARYARLGYSAKHFILRMSRIDMASFLALKHETVSRALSHLHDLSYIDVQRREVRVLDVDGLRSMAGMSTALN